jgi:hypothetical protein
MTHLTVYINSVGYLLDLFENESISLTFRFQDVAKLEPQGSFSRSFRIPSTERNRSAFGALWDVNTQSVDFRRKIDATLSVDTVPVSTGHIQIQKVYTRAGEIHEVELTFFAETPDLSTAIGDKKLSAIASLDDLDVEVNFTNVTASPSDTIWTLVDRGQKWSEEGQTGTRPVYNPSRPLYPADLTPAVKFRYLFDNIISEAGFTWSGWDSSTVLADALDTYFMPFLNQRYTVFDVAPEDALFELGRTTDLTGQTIPAGGLPLTFTEVFDNGNNVASSIYTAPYTGFFTFRMWATVRVTAGLGPSDFVFLQVFNPNTNVAYWSSQPLAVLQQNTNYNFHGVPTPIFLNVGDQVQFRVAGLSGCTVTLKGDAGYDPQLGTGWKATGTSGPLANADILFYQNAPDMKQIDFLRDILKMHNCVVIPDRNIPNKLYIEPLSTFIGTGASKDWTGKLDVSKDITISPTNEYLARVNHFTYKAGSEYASGEYSKLGRIYGDYKVEGYTVNETDPPNDFAQGEQKIELVMASTPCYEIAGTGIIIPKFINDKGEFVVPGPRALFYAGDAANVQLFNDGDSSVDAITARMLNHYSAVFPDLNDDDLNFAPEDPIYSVNQQPYYNLFNTYYRTTFNELYARDARVMVAHFYLTLSDILQFSFADKIFIKDAYWRIIEISGYNFGERDTTQVTLMKIVTPELDCAVEPFSISLGGVVTFIDADEVTSGGTQECCERYGYVWLDDRCYANTGTGNNAQGMNQGVQGIGFGGQSGENPQSALSLNTGSEISPDTVYSIAIGQGIVIPDGNYNTFAMGDTLRLIGANRGANLIGRNALANVTGWHLGGGWEAGDRTGVAGRAQVGTIVLQGSGDYTTNATEIELFIDGESGNRINLIDGTTWNCVVSIMQHEIDAGAVTDIHNAVYMVAIYKDAGIAKVSDIVQIAVDGSTGTLQLDVQISGSNEHEFITTLTGGGHPHNNCFITARIDYTQVRSEDVIS